MTMYVVKAQGYGGEGPSVSPYYSDDISAVEDVITELLETDHAVQLYRIDSDGVAQPTTFETYTTIKVWIPGE
jgi:hypothetical protein